MTGGIRLGLALGIALLGVPAFEGGAAASHTPISTTADSTAPGSLRAALTAATAGETVVVPPGTYQLSAPLGELTVDAAVIIDGAGAGTTVIDGQGANRVLRFILPGVPGTFATVRDVTITGGAASGGNSEGGGGIFNDQSGGLIVLNSRIVLNSAGGLTDQPVTHGGGGIQNKGPDGLFVVDSTVSNNSVTHDSGGGTASGGGGIHNDAGPLTVLGSTVSGNVLTGVGAATQTGGGGIHSRGSATFIRNSTISGNAAVVPTGATNGGGGVFTGAAGTSNELRNVTVYGNSTNGLGGGLLASSATATTTVLESSILAANSATNCAEAGAATIGSGGGNMEAPGNTCGLLAADFPGTDPGLGPLADNGGPTRTHALPPGSAAIDRVSARECAPSGPDQRGVARPKGAACDIGAYEFDGLSATGAASCAQGGTVAVTLTAPAGATVTSVRFRIDGGPENGAPAAGTPAAAAIVVPPGTHTLEYWAAFADGTQESGHHVQTVVMSACPTQSTPGTGLPPPVLGRTFNVEPLSGRVYVSLPRGATLTAKGRARAAASVPGLKGRRFVALKEARQIPIGSFLDTRRGRVRLTTARDTTSKRLQAGVFYSGVFQVLQSRRRSSRGLTDLRMKGASFASCARKPRARRSSALAKVHAAKRRLSRRTIRRIRANARGRFRTRGRYSSATVRGTIWSTTDRCDGTLTRVSRGSVTVRDFRRRKDIVVRRGKAYLAKARRG